MPHRCISTQYQLVLYQWRGAQRAPRARARARARPSSALAKHADPCTSPRSSACADGTGRDAHTTGVAKECDPRGPARAVLMPYVVPCSSDHTLLIDDPGALERRRSLGQTAAVQCSADQCQCRCQAAAQATFPQIREIPIPDPVPRSPFAKPRRAEASTRLAQYARAPARQWPPFPQLRVLTNTHGAPNRVRLACPPNLAKPESCVLHGSTNEPDGRRRRRARTGRCWLIVLQLS